MSRLSELDPFRTSTKPSHKSPSSKDTSNIPQSPHSSNTNYTSSFLNNQAKNLKFTYPTTYKPNHITSFSHQKPSNNDPKKQPISYQNFSLKYTPPKSQSEKVTPIKAFTPLSSHQNLPLTPQKATSSYKKFQPKGLSYLEMTQPFAQSYSHSSHTPRDEIESLRSVEIEIKDRLANIYSVKDSPASSPWIKTLKSPSSSQGTPHLRAQTINTDILRISLEKQLDKGFKKKKPSSQIGTPTRTDMSDFAESIISQFEHRTKIIEQSENLISKYSSPKVVGYNKHLISKKNSTNSSAIQSPKASLHQKNVNKQIDFDVESQHLKESENNTPQKNQWNPLPEDEEVLYLDAENNDEIIKENSKEEGRSSQLESSLKGVDLSRESPEPSNKASTLDVLFDAEKRDKGASSKEIITSELPTPEFSKVLISRSGSMNIYDTLKKRKPSHLKLDSKNLESSPESSKDEGLKKPSLGSSPDVSSPMKNKVQSIDNLQQAILKGSFVEEEEEFSLKKRGGVNRLKVEQPQQMKDTPRFPSGRGSKNEIKKSESLENKDLVQEQEIGMKGNNKEGAKYEEKLSEKLEEKLMELRLGKPEVLKKEKERGDSFVDSVRDVEEEKSEGLNVSLGKEESLSYEEPTKAFVEERNENNIEEGFENNRENMAFETEDARPEKADMKETKPVGITFEFGNGSNIFERKNLSQVQGDIEKNSFEENQENSIKSEHHSVPLNRPVEEETQIIVEKVMFDLKGDGLKDTQQIDSQEMTVVVESKPVKEEILAFEELVQNESINISQELAPKESLHTQDDSCTENKKISLDNKFSFGQTSEVNLVKSSLLIGKENQIITEKVDLQKEEDQEDQVVETNQTDSHERFSEIVPVPAAEEVGQFEELAQNKSIEINEEFIREGHLQAPSLRNEGIKTRAKISFLQSADIRLAPSKQETVIETEMNPSAKEGDHFIPQEIGIGVQKETERVDAKESHPVEKAIRVEVKVEEGLSLGGLVENKSIEISHQELTQEGQGDVRENGTLPQTKPEEERTLSLKELVPDESMDIPHQELVHKRSKGELESKVTQNAENDFVLRGEKTISSQDTTPANEEGNQIPEKIELDFQKEDGEKTVPEVGSQDKPIGTETKAVKEEVLLMEELVQNGSVDVSQKLIGDKSMHVEEKALAKDESEPEAAQIPENDLAQSKQETAFSKNMSLLVGVESQKLTETAENTAQIEPENEQPSSQGRSAPLRQAQAQEEIIDFEEFAQVESIDVSQELTQEQSVRKSKTENEPEASFSQNLSLINPKITSNKKNLSPNQSISANPETNLQQFDENVSVEIEAPKALPEENLTFFEFKLPQSTEVPLAEEPIQKPKSEVLNQESAVPNKATPKNLPKSLQISPQETPPVTPKGLSQQGALGVPLFHSQSQETPSPKPKRSAHQKAKSSSHQYKSLSLDLPSHSPEQHNTPTRPQEIALLSSVIINDSPKKVSLMKKGIIVMDDNMTEGSNHQEDPNFCKEYYTDSRVSESCSFQDIDESSQHSPSRCELISFEEFSVVPKDNRKSQTSPKRPNIQFYYEEKSQETVERKRSKKESIEINISQIPFNVSNTAFSAFSGDFNVSSVTKNEQEMSGKNLSFFTGEQQQTEISQAFDQNISPINAPRYMLSQELGRKLSTFALSRGLSEFEGRPSTLQVSGGEKGGFMEPKSLGNSGEFQRVVDKESKSLMKQISTLESIDHESDHSVNVDSFILPSNLSLPKTQELKISTGDFDIQGDQAENESLTSSPDVSFNGGKSVIPMMKFENLKTEFENISLTGSIIVFDNNLYYANNAGPNKELEKRPLDDLNPVTEERSLEMTQSEEAKSEARTDSLTETQKQEENDAERVNKNLAKENVAIIQENPLKTETIGTVSFAFPKIRQELKISTGELEENEEQNVTTEKSLSVGPSEIPMMRLEDLKTDFNKISLTGSIIVFDNNLYYSNNEDKKELEKQPLDDLNAVIEERSIEMTQSEQEEVSGEDKTSFLIETQQEEDDELAVNQQLARESMIILQENALEKYFRNTRPTNLPFPKLRPELKISTEDPEENKDQSAEKSLEIGTSEIPVMKLENFKTDFDKISLTGSMIVFDNNLYYSKNTNNKELETQPIDDSDPIIEERSVEMTQSEETTSEAKGNCLTEAEQKQDDDLAVNQQLAKENMMILEENALEKYFRNKRLSIEMAQSEESNGEVKYYSLTEVEQQIAINKSLAKENMMILQENALERYFKNMRPTNLPFPELQQALRISAEDFDKQGELVINKILAKENMVILQEKALEKYFRTVRLSLDKTQSEAPHSEDSPTETQQQRDDDLKLNKILAKENMRIIQKNALEKFFKKALPSLEMTQSEESNDESKHHSLTEVGQHLAINKSLARENMLILQENALKKYFRNVKIFLQKTYSEETNSESSLREIQQHREDDLVLNQTLAKGNMMTLQENALEKYFRTVKLSLDKTQSEAPNSENSLAETQQQRDDDLFLHKILAKENTLLLQENALNRYFKNSRSANLSLHKIPELKVSSVFVNLEREQREGDSQNSTPDESLEKEIDNINLAFENTMSHPNNFLDNECELYALGDLSPVCEEQSCEMICSEANSPTTTQQQQEDDLIINQTLAKENVILLQENALTKFFNNVRPTNPPELKILPIILDLQADQNSPSEGPLNAPKEMKKINLAFENNMSHPNTLRNEEFEMWALGNLSPVCEERSCEITCSEANSPTTTQKSQQNDSNINKTLTKENVIFLQENAFKKKDSKNARSLNLSPLKTQELTISSGDLDLQEVPEHHSNTPGKSSTPTRSPVPMMKFDNLKTDFENIALTGSIVLNEGQLPPVTEERSFDIPQSEEVREALFTVTFRKQQDNDEILLLNKTLAQENVLIIQENALKKYFKNRQPPIPETMTFRSKAVDPDLPLAGEKSPVEELQERKSNPKVLKPLMSFGGTEEDEEEAAKSIILPTDPSALENRGFDTRNLSDISEVESLNNALETPKRNSPLAGPKIDPESLKESIFLNSSPYHLNNPEERLPTFGSSILKQPTIPSIISSNPEKPLSDPHNNSISGSTESHNDSPTKQSQPAKFRNSSMFKGFTMAQTLMMTPDLGFSSPMSIDKGQFNQPPTLGRQTSVPSDQDSNHKRPSKMSSSTSNLFRLTPLDGTADLLEERKSIDTRGSHQRSLQYEKTKAMRRSFLHKNLLQTQFSTEEIIANNSHNKHRAGGQNRENLSNNTAKSSGEVSERFSLSDISLSMLQNEELNLSNNGDISGEIAPQEDFLKSLNFNDSLLLPGQLTRNGSLEDLQYDISAVYNENIGRIETYKKLGNQAGCIKLLKELAHEIEKQEKEEGEESPDSQKEMINYKFYKIQIYNMLSLEHYEMKSFEEALDYTNKVIELDRYNIQALYKSYQIHVKLKKEAEAKSILKRVRKLMQFQPMSGSFQHMKLDNISIPSALSSSTNGSFYEGLQNMGSSLAFAKMNGGDWGKSLSRFKLQHLPTKNDQASNSGN